MTCSCRCLMRPSVFLWHQVKASRGSGLGFGGLQKQLQKQLRIVALCIRAEDTVAREAGGRQIQVCCTDALVAPNRLSSSYTAGSRITVVQ